MSRRVIIIVIPVLARSGPFWPDLVRSGPIWPDPARCGLIWWPFAAPGARRGAAGGCSVTVWRKMQADRFHTYSHFWQAKASDSRNGTAGLPMAAPPLAIAHSPKVN